MTFSKYSHKLWIQFLGHLVAGYILEIYTWRLRYCEDDWRFLDIDMDFHTGSMLPIILLSNPGTPGEPFV